MPKKKNIKLPTQEEIKKNKEPSYKVYCMTCGATNQRDFYSARDEYRQFYKKIPYCKACIRDIFLYYMKKYRDNNLALYYTCRKIDVPYNHTAYMSALKEVNNNKSTIQGEENIISAYMKLMALSEANGWGICFDDSNGENLIQGLETFDIYTKVKKSRRIIGEENDDMYDILEYDTSYLQNKWGDFVPEDLSYLESEYLDWAEKLGGSIDEKSIDVIVKQICYQTLEINKDRSMDKDVNKLLTGLTALMNNAGLIEKQKNSVSASLGVGQRIEDIEKRRPIREVDSELVDVDNLEELKIDYIGTTARALGKENWYTKKFDEINHRYSVDIIENRIESHNQELFKKSEDLDSDTD